MLPLEVESAIRADVFRWLDERFLGHGGYELSRAELESYTFDGERLPLVDTGRGIRNPREFRSTLSILTGWKANRYNDSEDDDGWVTYHYQARDGRDNVKLLHAVETGAPIVYFRAVREGFYYPFYPIVISENDPIERVIRFPLDQALTLFGDPLELSEQQRRYAESIVQRRLHQPVFRARVLHAYAGSCTVCDLRHAELLDAAHIVPDAAERGTPSVRNGLALCKIHHAAYDSNLMGITPTFEVRINQALLDEVDGPMLRHGLQDMHGRRIRLPAGRTSRPDQDRLAERFDQFAAR